MKNVTHLGVGKLDHRTCFLNFAESADTIEGFVLLIRRKGDEIEVHSTEVERWALWAASNVFADMALGNKPTWEE